MKRTDEFQPCASMKLFMLGKNAIANTSNIVATQQYIPNTKYFCLNDATADVKVYMIEIISDPVIALLSMILCSLVKASNRYQAININPIPLYHHLLTKSGLSIYEFSNKVIIP